jgi:DNA-binding transcriptional ArsR family regulator
MTATNPTARAALCAALGHPLRVRVLDYLTDGEPASPVALAERLGEPLGNVAYHVRVLAEAGILRSVREIPRRGAIEHVYEVGAAGELRKLGRWLTAAF